MANNTYAASLAGCHAEMRTLAELVRRKMPQLHRCVCSLWPGRRPACVLRPWTGCVVAAALHASGQCMHGAWRGPGGTHSTHVGTAGSRRPEGGERAGALRCEQARCVHDQQALGGPLPEAVSAAAAARRHLEALGCDVSILSTDWFLTLFCTRLPAPVAARVWDVLLFEGSKARGRRRAGGEGGWQRDYCQVAPLRSEARSACPVLVAVGVRSGSQPVRQPGSRLSGPQAKA